MKLCLITVKSMFATLKADTFVLSFSHTLVYIQAFVKVVYMLLAGVL
jgi:hypothetical protein